MKRHTEVTIRLSRGRIIYNLSNNAYVVGDQLVPGHRRHQVQDVVEGQNLDLVERVLWRAYCHVRKIFEPYLLDCGQPPVEGDAAVLPPHQEPGDYVFHLGIPGTMPKATADYWAILADEYITSTAMCEWLEIVSPEQAPAWRQKAEHACQQLGESLHVIRHRVRKRMEKV